MTTAPSPADADEAVETVLQLGYASAATHPFTDDELDELLATSRRNNEALGVTGMLLYHEGSFLQVLEGEADVVETLYAKITRDKRHADAILLFRKTDAERTFGDWTMGFHRLSKDAATPAGLNSFLQTGASGITSADGERIRDVLVGFRDGQWRRVVEY